MERSDLLRVFRATGIVLLAVSIFVLGMILPMPAHAQRTPAAQAQAPASSEQGPAKTTVTVSPPTAELTATPGSTLEHTIKLTNSTEIAREFSVRVQNFGALGEEGQPDITDDLGPHALSQWVKVDPQTVTIKANEKQEFKISISVPAEATPGGHFGILTFSPKTTEGGQVAVVAEVSSLILLRVPGAATEGAEIAGVNVCKPPYLADPSQPDQKKRATTCDKNKGFFTSGGDFAFTTRVRNTGNVHVRPQGKLKLYNLFGKEVASFDVAPRNVIPNSVRRLDVSWKSGLLIGQYRLRGELSYGTQGQTLKYEQSFWAFPRTQGLLVLGGIIVLFLLFWLPRKRFKKAFRALLAAD